MKLFFKQYKYYILGLLILIIILIIVYFSYFCSNKTESIIVEDVNNNIVIDEKEHNLNYIVEIKGAVVNPGVYVLDSNSRVNDVVNMAGGFREDASSRYVNLSKKIEDEMSIIIYTNEEVNSYKKSDVIVIEESCVCPEIVNDACLENITKDNLISINTASVDELMTLPGIGNSKAKAIIEYRNENTFDKIEDIMNVGGIGQSLFDAIKEYIKI